MIASLSLVLLCQLISIAMGLNARVTSLLVPLAVTLLVHQSLLQDSCVPAAWRCREISSRVAACN
jgi:hypothetical protein